MVLPILLITCLFAGHCAAVSWGNHESDRVALDWARQTDGGVLPIRTWRMDLAAWATHLSALGITAIAVNSLLQ